MATANGKSIFPIVSVPAGEDCMAVGLLHLPMSIVAQLALIDVRKCTLYTVLTGPTFREPPASTAAALGRTVNLTCTAEGFPTPTYQWYKDGVAIPGEERTYLYIEEVAPEDRGNYTCVAMSTGGMEESQPARLTIPGIMLSVICFLRTQSNWYHIVGIYQYTVVIPVAANEDYHVSSKVKPIYEIVVNITYSLWSGYPTQAL